MSMKLISFYQKNPPDLAHREYLRGLGIKYSDAEIGEAQVGRMMALPPASASAIVKTDTQGAMKRWLSNSVSGAEDGDLSHDLGTSVPQDSGSLVAPLLWLPGVLRSQGPWATVMKETLEGTAYGLSSGVNLITQTEDIPLSQKGPSVGQQLMDKDRLISELERALAKQNNAGAALAHSAKEMRREFVNSLNKARRQEKARHEKDLQTKLEPLRQTLRDVKEDFGTLRKAYKTQLSRAYAQDNFVSQYSKALSSVKQMARDIANKEQAQLRNKVGALERSLAQETRIKRALRDRTDLAESIADLKFRKAESKIPELEKELLQSHVELEQSRRTLKSKMYHFTRAVKDHEGQAKKDREDIAKFAKENERLKQELADLKFRYKTDVGYYKRHSTAGGDSPPKTAGTGILESPPTTAARH